MLIISEPYLFVCWECYSSHHAGSYIQRLKALIKSVIGLDLRMDLKSCRRMMSKTCFSIWMQIAKENTEWDRGGNYIYTFRSFHVSVMVIPWFFRGSVTSVKHHRLFILRWRCVYQLSLISRKRIPRNKWNFTTVLAHNHWVLVWLSRSIWKWQR